MAYNQLNISWESFGRIRPIYQKAGKGFIYFITLRLISETRAYFCRKDKVASDDHGMIAAKSMQANKVTRLQDQNS